MEDTLELFARGRIGKDETGKSIAPETAIWSDDVRAKRVLNFGESWLAGLDQLACQKIGINNRYVPLGKQRCRGGFPHTNPAGETQNFQPEVQSLIPKCLRHADGAEEAVVG